MADIWEIAQYVEEHPDDHEQRWRLAKKLYTAWEYRLALEHLQVLRNEWTPKLNIARYLSATLYRLGRHEEALREIERAMATWPDDLGMQEQYARVLEVADRREDAARAWARIAHQNPQHPIAKEAAERLSQQPQETAQADLNLGSSDSGIDITPGKVCPNCGAQNSDEFDRCWQCHTNLDDAGMESGSSTLHERKTKAPAQMTVSPELLLLGLGLSVIALGALSLYLSLRLLLKNEGFLTPDPSRVFWMVYDDPLRVTRVAIGIVMAVGWPLALTATFHYIKPPRIFPPLFIFLIGALFSFLAYVASWLPPNALILAPLLPAVLSLATLIVIFAMPPSRAFLAWIMQLAIVLVLAMMTFSISEYWELRTFYNPITTLPEALKASRDAGKTKMPGHTEFPSILTPITQDIKWRSTGSEWLDQRASGVWFLVENDSGGTVKFELKQGPTGTVIYEPSINGSEWQTYYKIQAEVPYTIVVTDAKNGAVPVRVSVAGALVPELK